MATELETLNRQIKELEADLADAQEEGDNIAAMMEDSDEEDYDILEKDLNKQNKLMDKLEKQLEIAKKKRDGMKSTKANWILDGMSIQELNDFIKKLKKTIRELKVTEKRQTDENEIQFYEQRIKGAEDDLADAEAVLKQRKKEQQNADAFGRSSKSTLVSDLIAAEDNGDELEAAIVRAKIRKASASNVDSREALAVKGSVRATVRPGETSGLSDERELQLLEQNQSELKARADEINREIAILQREYNQILNSLQAIGKRINKLR